MTSVEEFDFTAALTDGSPVHIRTPRTLHDRVSQRSHYLRYFSLSRRSAEQYVDKLLAPHIGDLPGLVAILDGGLVAVASYERLTTTDEAEVAFLVDDLHQGQGIATLLLETLGAAAAQRGIIRFVAEELLDNWHMLEVFTTAGYTVSRRYADGVVRIEFPLAPTEVLLQKIAERERTAGARSISRLLSPTSIAVIGAGRDPDGIGHAVLRNLVDGGFRGQVYPVNSSASDVAGRSAYSSVLRIPAHVDLVVIAVPAAAVPGVIAECTEAGVGGAVIVSAGFAETGSAGAVAERDLVMSTRSGGMRLIGPNCFGVVNTDPDVRMNATFSATEPSAGRLGMLTQSGAVGIALLDQMARRRLGVSTFVSDVSSNDLLMYWDQDGATDVVMLYLESSATRAGSPGSPARCPATSPSLRSRVAVRSWRSGGSLDTSVPRWTSTAATGGAVPAEAEPATLEPPVLEAPSPARLRVAPLRPETAPPVTMPPLPVVDGGHQTILADPPWRFQNRTGKVAPEHRRLDRYDTMTTEAICALPVTDVVADAAHLYLWVPNALLPEGLSVLHAWGFRYVSNLVWAKRRKDGGPDGRGVGFYFRNVTEMLLFGVRGSLRTLGPARRQVNMIETRKREHSRKPDEQYEIIQACSPGPYLELFVRYPRAGWSAWGHEAAGEVTPRGRRHPGYSWDEG
jgi:N6-adenosine-specific RNA methylase IME4/predicted CoA-binding protein/GNAT superfamily N-acetyltransferase